MLKLICSLVRKDSMKLTKEKLYATTGGGCLLCKALKAIKVFFQNLYIKHLMNHLFGD